MRNGLAGIYAGLAVLAMTVCGAGAEDGEVEERLRRLPAFPGAWGAGMYATGGRDGEVLKVTTLNDSGPGSLRAAVEAAEPRIVVFEVAGTIELESPLVIENDNITIAGQTAPGDGICLGNGVLVVSADDVIVRYLRVRRGDRNPEPEDGIRLADAANVIIDHCTVSWTTDEAINTWHGTKNATFQWSLIGPSLHDSAVRPGHGYAASLGGENTTYHHNLLAHNAGRNPSIAGNNEHRTIKLDWRNNLVYNFGHRTLDGKPDSINIIGNYYKPGPATTEREILAGIDDRSAYNLPVGTWYISGNLLEGQTQFADDNWEGYVEVDGGVRIEEARLEKPHSVAPVPTQPAEEIMDPILRHAGTTVPRRDPLDRAIVEDTRLSRARFGDAGIIGSQDEMGGWPELRADEPALDRDDDGMPDWWEVKHGLAPEDPSDATEDLNGSGYTNIEEYVNGTDPTANIDYRRPENNRNPLHGNPGRLLPQ